VTALEEESKQITYGTYLSVVDDCCAERFELFVNVGSLDGL